MREHVLQADEPDHRLARRTRPQRVGDDVEFDVAFPLLLAGGLVPRRVDGEQIGLRGKQKLSTMKSSASVHAIAMLVKESGKLGADAMKRVAAGRSSPVSLVFEPGKCQ